MGKLKLFFACLLMAVLSIGQIWADDVIGTINFGNASGRTNVNAASVTGDDSQSNTWTVTTAGTTSFTPNASWAQIGSSNKPATSITFTTTLAAEQTITAFSAKFGGFNGTAGTVTLKVGDETVGTGSLSGTTDVTVENSSSEAGTVLTVEVTGIAKGVKAYFISYAYSDGGGTKTLSSVAISGNPAKTSYYAGQDFDPAGLVVTGTYSDASSATISSGITWSYNPSQTLALNQTSIGVTATVDNISSEEVTISSLSVTEAPAAVNYEKVTAAPDDWSGEYLIVYETSNKARVWTGVDASNCYAEADINADVIAKPENAVSVTIASMDGGYSILVNGGTNDGKYIGRTATSNGLNFSSSELLNTLSYENNAVTIISNNLKFRYNSSSGQDRFRYFTSAQQVIQLYKKVEGTVKPSAGLAFETSAYLVKANGSLATPTLSTADGFDGTVTYASSDADVVAVNTTTGALTIKAAGKAEITASSLETENFKAGSAKYTVYVAEQAGTAEDPLTEASAKALIDLGCTLNAHVNGIVLSQNSTNFTVTLTNGFQFYKAKDLNNVAFESAYLAAGDEVTAVGALKKFSSTYELDEGCYLTYYQQAATSLTPIANTKETAYSVATALGYAAEPLVYQLTDPIYIEGVVYKVENFNSTNGTLDIYIKDANADNEFELFKCKGIYDESLTAFTSADDVREGDQVIGYGVLKHFKNSTTDIWEFDNNATGDYLVSLVRPTIPVTDINLTESTASVAVGAKVTLHASVEPSTANNKTIVWSVQSGSDKASVADGVVTGIAEGTAVIRAASDEDASIYAECTVTVAPLSPWATTYTSNIELSTEGGTSASAAKVKFYGEDTEYAAIKAGTGSAAGAVVVNVPAQATALHFHAYSWYNETVELTVTAPDGVTVNPSAAIAINKNSGISGNSPFTLAEGSTPQYDAYYAVSLSGNSEPVALTISATSGKRFVLFGVNQEGGVVLQSIAVSGTASVLEYTDGQHFDPAGLGVTGTYTDASTAPITEGIVWAFDPDPLTEGTTSVSVTATAAGFTSAAFVVNGLTVAGAAPLSPWATTWTSNLDDITGSKVKFYGEETEYAALKAGSSGTAGSATLNIPAQATELHLHAYGWNSEDVTLSITAPDGVTVTPASITLNRNSGFAGNSPFTLEDGSTPQYDAYYAVSLSGNTEPIDLTITATAGKRFLLFGVNQVGGVLPVLKSITISGDLTTKTGYKAGDALDLDGLTVMATYSIGGVDQSPVDITSDPELELTYDPLVEDQTEVTITASYKGQTDDITITGLDPVASADPKIFVEPSLTVNFGSVEVGDAVPAAQTITITLTNVAAVTATLGGTNPEAFSISKTEGIVSGDEITISVLANTDAAASYTATIAISDGAEGAQDKTVNLSFAVTAPASDDDVSGTWTLVTNATTLAAGKKVIIAQYVDADGDIQTMAAQSDNGNNRTAITSAVAGTTLTPAVGTKVMTLADAGEGKFYLKTSDGNYLYNASTSSKSYLKTKAEAENASWTIAADADGIATIASVENTNRTKIFYNSNNDLFNCYASGQSDIALYMLEEDEPTGDLIRDGLSAGKWGTLCPKQNVENPTGATFYQITSLVEKDDMPFNMIFDEIEGSTLTAGKPYFFIATGTEIRGTKSGAELGAADPAGVNGFYGYIGATVKALPYEVDYTPSGNNTYVIYNNCVCRINGATDLKSERCYININSTEPTRAVVSSNPSRRRITMNIQNMEAVQGFENIEASDKPMKLMIDGQLYILRGEKVYDATGRLVK